MSTINVTGKTLEEAIKKGLAEFNCSIGDVEVKVIKHPGIFSAGIIEMTYTGENPSQKTAGAIMRNLEKKIVQTQKDRHENNPGWQGKQGQKSVARQPQQPVQKSVAVQKEQSAQKPEERKEQKPVQKDQSVQKPAQKAQPAQTQKTSETREISAELMEKYKARAAEYLQNLLGRMDISANLTLESTGDEISINIGSDDSVIIGRRGETLDAIEYLTLLAVNSGDEKGVHVNVDAQGYRDKKLEMMKENAMRMADRTVKTGRPVNLEPMNSSARKIIHALLSERDDVSTKSEGKEPNRFIVIFPKKNGQPKNQNGEAGGGKNRQKKPSDQTRDSFQAEDGGSGTSPNPKKSAKGKRNSKQRAREKTGGQKRPGQGGERVKNDKESSSSNNAASEKPAGDNPKD